MPATITADATGHLQLLPADVARQTLLLPSLRPAQWRSPSALRTMSAKAPPWQALVFVSDYRPPISTLVKNFKFQQTPALAPTLARLILLHWLQAHREQHLNRPEVILAVPLQDKRCWRRGYNQSELLALPLARWLGCEYRPGALRRIRATAPQQKLIAACGGVICVVLSVVMRAWQENMWRCWMMWLPLAAPWQKSLHYYRSRASHRCRFGAFAARCSTTAMGVL